MGARYLTDLADVCRRTGWPVIEVDGWQNRARGSGGYESGRPSHIMVHHTASGPGSDGWDDVNYCTFGDDDAPLCNLYLSRVPEIFICAAGATNTNGSGHDPCGITADDSMNSSAIGIEAANDGVGEVWNEDQQAAYTALCGVLSDAYGIAAAQVHAHWEWTSRKIDPAGPSDWATSGSWDMHAFRADVGAPPPPPTPSPAKGIKSMFTLFVTDSRWPGQVELTDAADGIRWNQTSLTAAINRLAGSAEITIDRVQLLELLKDRPGIGPCPFDDQGSGYEDDELAAAW